MVALLLDAAARAMVRGTVTLPAWMFFALIITTAALSMAITVHNLKRRY